jgi:hypothetical protein
VTGASDNEVLFPFEDVSDQTWNMITDIAKCSETTEYSAVRMLESTAGEIHVS